MKRAFRQSALPAIFCALLIARCTLAAQQASPETQHPTQNQTQVSQPATEHGSAQGESSGGPNDSINQILEHTTERASHTSETWGKPFGLSKDTSYLISVVLNFFGIALLFYLLLRAKLPQMFRDRTRSIQSAIHQAQAASAEATEKLKNVAARLARLDSEVAAIRAEAEKQASAEEQKIRMAADQDKARVVESAKMEIDAIARNARRELKSYASTLAVDIAAKRIHVDENSDQTLVRNFVSQLGKDGR